MKHKFIESICLHNGRYKNLLLHQERVNKTFAQFFKGTNPFSLTSILPNIDLDGTYKVRIVYDSDCEDLEFIEYKKRKIETIEIVESKKFSYTFKFDDRRKIDKLIKSSNADDIIILMDGEIKDSSYANLAFWNGEDWITPANPLLEGVRRAQLLAEGKIQKAPIHVSDLDGFEKVSLINAMLDLGDVEVDIKDLRGF
jgi:4-amino-4-deoxychorismate lyase